MLQRRGSLSPDMNLAIDDQHLAYPSDSLPYNTMAAQIR
jgi:hypothetical protein